MSLSGYIKYIWVSANRFVESPLSMDTFLSKKTNLGMGWIPRFDLSYEYSAYFVRKKTQWKSHMICEKIGAIRKQYVSFRPAQNSG